MARVHLGARWWKWAAPGAVLLIPALLVGCCCPGRVDLGPARRGPAPSALVVPVPGDLPLVSDSVTEAQMRNVNLHLDDEVLLQVHELRGRVRDLRGERLVVLDDKNTLLLEIAYGEIGLSARDLTLVLNRYVFGYPGSPLRNLVVRTAGDHIVQTGIMHKIVDIPFEMTATLSVTDRGMIRIHATRMEICGIDGQGLLRAVGASLEDLLDLSGAKGVEVDGNDLVLDPLASLPPPRIAGRLTAIRVRGDEVLQVFGSADDAGARPLRTTVAARNYVYFSGGTLRFGKLYMPLADMEAIDGDESDPFDFYLDYYHSQLTAGYHVTSANYGMVAYVPDFNDLGTPAARLAPPPLPGS
jgi:hypothetical protein